MSDRRGGSLEYTGAHARAEPDATAPNPINDDPNLARFTSADRVAAYDPRGGLTPAEAELVERWVAEGSRVLDIGVGTGRTYPELEVRASRYVGLDYAAPMVEAARLAFPDGEFEVADAADLTRFEDSSFDVVVFSYNGLDYLHPYTNRSLALSEMRRVLAPGGVLILSTHNPRAIVRWPTSSGGVVGLLRGMAIAGVATVRHTATMGPSKAFRVGAGYETDRVQGLLTFFATPDKLRKEVGDHGFQVVDLLPGDHPRPLNPFTTPWTYVAATRAESSWRIERLETPAELASVAQEWDRLVAEADGGTFQSREWVDAWSERLEPSAAIHLLVAREPGTGRVVGLLPVARMHRMLHQRIPIPLRYWGLAGAGPGAADHLGPIAESDAIGAALLEKFARSTGRSPVLLENLSPRWAPVVRAAVGGKVVRVTECPAAVRPVDASFSDSWSPKMRKNVRRRARQLDEMGVKARWVPAGSDFEAALHALRTLHAQRWESQGRPGLFDTSREQFLMDVARSSTPPDSPWVLLLERGGHPVAGLLGFRRGSIFSVYKSGWDPELARLSPGIALGVEAMRWAEEHGIVVFDYLRGPRSHKADLGCHPVADLTILKASGPTGWVLGWRERLSADGLVPSWVTAVRRRLG